MVARPALASAAGAAPARVPVPSRRVGAIAAAVVLLFLPLASSAGTYAKRGGARSLSFAGSEAVAGVELPDVFVVAGSDSVFVDGERLVRGRDYELEPSTGRLTVTVPVDPGAVVEVTYLHIPMDAERVRRRAVLESLAELPAGFAADAVLLEPVGRQERPDAFGHGLTVGGAKTFGITVGSNRDPSLEQSLRMNVNGRLTRDVSVAAYLSDQNTPLVPEGDTEELRALDEVLIEIEAPNASATLGDYTLELDGGPLARFRRDESGATVDARLGPANVTLAGARSAGRFRSVTFRGLDGKQGAYLLTDDAGATGVSVVPGSERVWIDGLRLTRGRDNDYVIDYSGGAIEFTERRPIVSEHEITVDYEFTTDDYRRDTYAARVALWGARAGGPDGDGSGAYARGGGSGVGVSFFREADDRDAVASGALSDKELAVLAAAGDDPELAHDDGVDSVGVGNGDYVYVSDGVFEYAGVDSGAYDLHFERVEGGDYDYDYVDGHYVYAGTGAGDYRLGRTLPMPSDHTLVAADGRLALPRGGYVEVSGALSDHDRNTFSDDDDGDNLGNAQVLSAAAPGVTLGGDRGAVLGLSVDARRVAGGFLGVGRYRELGYEERWEVAGLDLPEGESMAEASGSLTMAGGGGLTISHAFLERGDALDSRRTEFRVEGRPTREGRLWGSGRLVESNWTGEADDLKRDRAYYRAGFEQKLGAVRPGVTYARDERTENGAGERYDEYGASLASAGAGDLTYGASYARRLTDRSDGGPWDFASTTTTQEYRLRVSRWEALRVEGSVVRRETEFEEGYDDAASRYDLASLRLDHTSLSGGLTGEVRYSVTATEIEEKERFVTEEDGVEITRVVRTGRYLPVTDLSASTRWKLRPGRKARAARAMPDPTALGRLLSTLTLTSDIKLREMTTTSDKRRLYLFDPDVLQGDDTVRGELTSRHVARFLSSGSAFSLRLAVNTKDGLDRSYSNDSTRTRDRSGTVDAKLTRPGGVTYRVQADAGTRERAAGSRDDYDIGELSLLGEAGFRQLGDLEARLTASVASQDDAVSGVDVLVSKLTPAMTYRLAGRGAVTASVTRIEVTPSGGSLASATYLAEGRREGRSVEWRLNGDYRFNQFLTGSLSYYGEAREGSDPLHTMDLRVNAFF